MQKFVIFQKLEKNPDLQEVTKVAKGSQKNPKVMFKIVYKKLQKIAKNVQQNGRDWSRAGVTNHDY